MVEILEDLDPVLDDLVRLFTPEVRDESNATRIVLILRIIESKLRRESSKCVHKTA